MVCLLLLLQLLVAKHNLRNCWVPLPGRKHEAPLQEPGVLSFGLRRTIARACTRQGHASTHIALEHELQLLLALVLVEDMKLACSAAAVGQTHV